MTFLSLAFSTCCLTATICAAILGAWDAAALVFGACGCFYGAALQFECAREKKLEL